MEHLDKDKLKPIEDAMKMAISFEESSELLHANPEFKGTNSRYNFYYDPYYFMNHRLEEWLNNEALILLKSAVKYWKRNAKFYYRGELDLNEFSVHKEAFIFCANMFATQVFKDL